MRKIALVTGAAGCLGRQVANKLSEDGWDLIVVSRQTSDGKAQVISDGP